MSRGTTIRSLRVADDPWTPALERAQREGTTLTAVLVAFLEQYARGEVEAVTEPPR